MRREGAPLKPVEPEKARWGWGSDKLWWMKEVVELTWAKKFGKTRGLVGEDDDDAGGNDPAKGRGKNRQRSRNEENLGAVMEEIREAKRWAGDRLDETDSDTEGKNVARRAQTATEGDQRSGGGKQGEECESTKGEEGKRGG